MTLTIKTEEMPKAEAARLNKLIITRVPFWAAKALTNCACSTIQLSVFSPSESAIISETVQVRFPGNCQQNLALVNFQQTRPF